MARWRTEVVIKVGHAGVTRNPAAPGSTGSTSGFVVELLGTLLQGDRRGLDLDGVDGGCVANVVAANAGIAAAHVCREEDRAVLAVVGDLGAEDLDHLVPHDRMHGIVLGQRRATLCDDMLQVFLHLLEDGIGEVDPSGDRGKSGLGAPGTAST